MGSTLRFSQPYTVGLLIISACIVVGAGGQLFYMVPAQPDDQGRRLHEFVAFAEFTVALFIGTVAVLRARKSPVARPATLALNALWVLWLGFGTAIFIWWFGWVRAKERPEPYSTP